MGKYIEYSQIETSKEKDQKLKDEIQKKSTEV